MARADDYLEYFRRVPMFSTCSKKDLKTVAANAERVDVPAGRILCEQGQTGREAFVIVDGKARVLRNGRKVAIIGPGTTFGELSLLDTRRGTRPCSPTATWNCSCSANASS